MRAHALEIFQGIHTEPGYLTRNIDDNLHPSLQRTQLLESFRDLQIARRQLGEFTQRAYPVGIDAEMTLSTQDAGLAHAVPVSLRHDARESARD